MSYRPSVDEQVFALETSDGIAELAAHERFAAADADMTCTIRRGHRLATEAQGLKAGAISGAPLLHQLDAAELAGA